MYERTILQTGEPLPRRSSPGGGTPMIALDEVSALLWNNKAGIAASVAACLLAALAFLILALPSYVASTQIIIDPTDLRVVDNSLRPQTNISGDTQLAQVEDEIRVITSSTVLRRVVEAQHLADDPEFAGAGPTLMSRLTSALAGLLQRPPKAAEDPTADAVRALARKVTAKREERTFVVTVTVTTHEAEKSARLADAVVAAFLQVAEQTRNDATRRIADSLSSRLNGLRQDVEAAEQKVVDYKATHGMVAAVGQNVTEQQLASASTRLSDIRARLSDAQSRYAQVVQAQRGGDIGAVPEALQSPTIGALRSQLADVMRREGDLAATLGQRHPALNEVRAQARNVAAQLHAELARIAAVLKTNRDRAQADLAAAEANYRALEASVTSKSRLSVQLGELERAAQADRAIYEAFLARTRQVGEQEKINTANISVISPAQVPDAKSWPPRPVYVLLAALILGLVLSVGATVGLELLARRRPLSRRSLPSLR